MSSARGELEVKALVTPRMKALKIGGQEVTVVWMPYNWGFQGLSTGPSVNHLTIDAVDPGAGTQETKACLVNVVRAGRPATRRSGVTEGTHMSEPAATGPIRTDADRHRQLHRLPRLPGRLQAVERARRRADRAQPDLGFQNPGDAQREDATR